MNTFIVEQKFLSSILAFTQPIVSKKTAIPSTAYILFQINAHELVIKATEEDPETRGGVDDDRRNSKNLRRIIYNSNRNVFKEIIGQLPDDNLFYSFGLPGCWLLGSPTETVARLNRDENKKLRCSKR